MMSDVVIYEAEGGQSQLQERLDHDTVWLTQEQMASLFGRERSVVTKHIRNIFHEGELAEDSVCAKFALTAADGKSYDTAHYNLDVIISIGYRVKSRQGTRFRQWATRVLRQHIVSGYSVNEQRLREEGAKLREMQQTVALLARTLTHQELVSEAGRDVLAVITDYAYALTLLDRYDHGSLTIEGTTGELRHTIGYEEGIAIVAGMKGQFDGLFGLEKDQGFKSALSTIHQTFDGRGSSGKVELYGIKKLRELILELAVRGLLVPQNPNDEPASELLKKIAAEKAKLVKAGKIKKRNLYRQLR